MGTETEIKLKLPRQADDEMLMREIELQMGAGPGCWQLKHMVSRYYDRTDGALSEAQISLRERSVNDIRVITVKAPSGGGAFTRKEWEAPCAGHELADALKTLDLGETEKRLLLPVMRREMKPEMIAEAVFDRRYRLFLLPGAEIEAAIDRGQLKKSGRSAEFAELELELKAGDKQILLQTAEHIEKRLSLEKEHETKLQRALKL